MNKKIVVKPHVAPEWTRIANDNSMVNRKELAEWLGCDQGRGLERLITYCGMPPPRATSVTRTTEGWFRPKTVWRVGDIRAWLTGTQEDLDAALKVSLGGERKLLRHADTGRWIAHKWAMSQKGKA